ncbi:thiamine pyrophosphate-dependent dehydrogenase E1 component subunit alpha [Telmatocola sphagniphila]|uniref:2-oxoisovalerate dehydrogenase subunit alpha n=1 Tax=Telmatocola sphagniphila TaxID=1123043 RepID=A0A8E6EXD6_9BACT|nr:thiamine pyrophosphate-dependent enzyme [Telmatocola sphagniphila]QVL34777.1 thiamine pyrophosphate-dependent dehydrogenase E1 component subunit alpha [Telmatocola sphagniphila]
MTTPREDSEEDYSIRGIQTAKFLDYPELHSKDESLSAGMCLKIYKTMARVRALEQRTIKMSKSGEGYFWVGGPGEEAFNVCLGLQVHKGRGPAFDYLHLHYRSAGVMMAMGMPMADHFRQMAMKLTDRHSKGRNFVGHYAIPEWNVVPVSSVIEVQYTMAPGTAIVQKRHGGEGVSVVTGGDAGTAEGDFTSCMIWSTRPNQALPVLMIVTNNGFGISTAANTQHGESSIAARGNAFGIPGEVVDGNDVIACWWAIYRAFDYCRTTRRPYILEAKVSRLHGHSSSSGASRVSTEADCITLLEEKLIANKILNRETAEMIHQQASDEADTAVDQVMQEADPTADDVNRYTFAPSRWDVIYPDDYTGLPS